MTGKTLVIYTSETGFTKRYAEWIAQALSAECLELKDADKRNPDEFQTIIFGGWAIGGFINKIKWFKKNMTKWQDKKLAVFCVGAGPIENPDIEVAMKNWFTPEEYEHVSAFYCPGGLNYEKMPARYKLMMKMFVKMLKGKKEKTEADLKQIEMISSSYDISDRKYIEPIVEWANSREA
ncbi:MAG: flavodoxin [Lachnospiraceae bacterium]|nr:flavodoxin [Lachnospiraceae bacterium]